MGFGIFCFPLTLATGHQARGFLMLRETGIEKPHKEDGASDGGIM